MRSGVFTVSAVRNPQIAEEKKSLMDGKKSNSRPDRAPECYCCPPGDDGEQGNDEQRMANAVVERRLLNHNKRHRQYRRDPDQQDIAVPRNPRRQATNTRDALLMELIRRESRKPNRIQDGEQNSQRKQCYKSDRQSG